MTTSVLGEKEIAFIEANRAAAMITVGKDGYAKPVRIAYGVVDGKIWSSGNRNRVRTRRLLKDPRCTLYVHEPAYNFLTLVTTVTILDNESTVDDTVRYFRTGQGRPDGPIAWRGKDLPEDQFREAVIADERIIYQFEPVSFYGTY